MMRLIDYDQEILLSYRSSMILLPLISHFPLKISFCWYFSTKIGNRQVQFLKYNYNNFSNDEYIELLETKKEITAKKSNIKILDKKNLLLVRPSCGNMHQFVAEEDSCFFDICLPNYTADSLRRITYFNEISTHMDDTKARDEGDVCAETAAINNNI